MLWYYFKRVAPVIAVISCILAIVNTFWGSPFYKNRKIRVDNHSERIISLGDISDSLYVYYKGRNGYNIWKSHVKLENIGKQSILGAGSNSDLLQDTFEIRINNEFELIYFNVIQNDFDALLNQVDNTIKISFKIWNPEETMKIELLLSSTKEKISPIITGNERDIMGTDVQYNNVDVAKIEEQSNNLDWLIILKSTYPNYLFYIIKYLGLIIFIYLFIYPFIYLIGGIRKNYLLGKWKRKYWKSFLVELGNSGIPATEKEKYKKAPYDVPVIYKKYFTNIPSKPDGPWFILFTTLFISMFTTPLIIFILFAWNNL